MTKQKKITPARIIVGILILALIVSNVYFWNRSRNAGYQITIGRPGLAPVMDNGVQVGKTLSVDFTRSKVLKDKMQINAAIFTLIGADSIEAPELPEVPDAVMQIFDRETGVAYQYSLWLTEDSVIIGAGPDEDIHYRENKNAPDLRALVEQQLRAYGK